MKKKTIKQQVRVEKVTDFFKMTISKERWEMHNFPHTKKKKKAKSDKISYMQKMMSPMKTNK